MTTSEMRKETIIEEARQWLYDIVFADTQPEVIEEMTYDEIVQAIKSHYDGGLRAFITEANL